MSYYKDLREYIQALEEKGKLIRIKGEINKDTELHPLVRLQFRGLPEEERKAFLFENVVDSRGRRYEGKRVAVSVLGASREIYAIGMMCPTEEIGSRWTEAQLHPIDPRMVADGPVHEEVHVGETLLEHGGLDEFPIPISTPGFDIAPYMSSPYWVSKDPENHIRNVGTYRTHVKAPTRTGIYWGNLKQGVGIHWNKCKKLGIPLEAAIIIGAAPNIGFVSVAKLPQDVDEFTVAGGIAGEPVELVKCKTVDLEVPATAEIVIEGLITTREMEPEAPFGEAPGYMGDRTMMPYFTITGITHRKDPIWQSFISQYAPSESSKIKQIAWENNIYKYLRFDCNLLNVLAVASHEETSVGAGLVVIQTKNDDQAKVWEALETCAKVSLGTKIIVAVDEDIDPRNNDMVHWVMATRMQPHEDCRIVEGLGLGKDISLIRPGVRQKQNVPHEFLPKSSRLLVNATMKWPYLPVSLPKREFMERALALWQREGLPDLELKEPWWGYSLGYWTEEYEAQARAAVKGEYYRTGEDFAKKRRSCQD